MFDIILRTFNIWGRIGLQFKFKAYQMFDIILRTFNIWGRIELQSNRL